MRRLKLILIGTAVLAGSFFISLKVMDWIWPRQIEKPVLAQLPPLPPVAQRSEIIAPITIPLKVIAAALDQKAPRSFSGKADNPADKILSNADIDWTITRGPITAIGNQNALTLSTPLDGKLSVKGSLELGAGTPAGDALNNLLGAKAAQKLGGISIKSLNANAVIHGTATLVSRPTLLADWHVDPQLSAQVEVNNNSLAVAGAKVAVPAQVKPVLDKTVNDQVAQLQQRLRNDPNFRNSAQAQWNRMCRSIPLPSAGPGLPPLYVEIRPVAALAAQPRIDADTVRLALGMQAETRIVNTPTMPQCPFPDRLRIVPALDEGRVSIGVPIDMTFGQAGKIVEAQLKGRKFPEDGSGEIEALVKSASVDAAGDRLLISLLVHVREKASWFGFGADATVRIWGRPVLDQQSQILHFADLSVAVESDAAFGLLNAAAQRATPSLQKALQDHAVIDLKTLASGAQQKLADVITGMQRNDNGVAVSASVTNVRLGQIAFDSNKLRIIAQATGTMNVVVKQLPALQ
ncbi:MAG: DUF4403 family protein [Xanthobacteraceae bacterium]|nr:DUF4403 family protein [Xanthobacteraceae bacterium]